MAYTIELAAKILSMTQQGVRTTLYKNLLISETSFNSIPINPLPHTAP